MAKRAPTNGRAPSRPSFRPPQVVRDRLERAGWLTAIDFVENHRRDTNGRLTGVATYWVATGEYVGDGHPLDADTITMSEGTMFEAMSEGTMFEGTSEEMLEGTSGGPSASNAACPLGTDSTSDAAAAPVSQPIVVSARGRSPRAAWAALWRVVSATDRGRAAPNARSGGSTASGHTCPDLGEYKNLRGALARTE